MHWILLRGLTREHAHWGHFPTQLREAFPDQQFHTVDLPGTGIRFRDESPASIAGIRERVTGQVRHIPRPLGLIALSMGAMVAIDWAQHADPGEVQQLVLINTSTGFSPFWRRMRPGAWPKMLRLLARRECFHREGDILRLTSNNDIPLALNKRWYSIQRQRPVSRANAMRQLFAAARYRPRKKRPMSDALLLASEADRIVSWRCSAELARRWCWTLTCHGSAGHDLPLDDPDWCIRQLREWLADQDCLTR
ncbi:alpha/beta fold hydrolase [Marinobacter oulmenensis]|uniref:Pimeloyl-ACP methyl ester carboxylesterase n=1 Tax=Marinobacter oulmenensis TaxID=643747 RepID=A0A840UFZ6_9GAMM|nr:alpha/beta hydrolase [Marinobacter oulmenensis]MBB5319748.1 pimeloyl-ACP methyl ester carboxylesterase [Marinobacter oulmenensis]